MRGRGAAEELAQCRIRARVVDDDESPVAHGMAKYALDARYGCLAGVVDRNDDVDRRGRRPRGPLDRAEPLAEDCDAADLLDEPKLAVSGWAFASDGQEAARAHDPHPLGERVGVGRPDPEVDAARQDGKRPGVCAEIMTQLHDRIGWERSVQR